MTHFPPCCLRGRTLALGPLCPWPPPPHSALQPHSPSCSWPHAPSPFCLRPQVMASASSTSAKNLFVDSKRRLGERVHLNINNLASISRQVLRGSQSADLLTKAARNMAIQVNTDSARYLYLSLCVS